MKIKREKFWNSARQSEWETVTVNDDYRFTFKIDDSSLGRMYQHSKNGFFIISAWRDKSDYEKQNVANSLQLEKDIRSYGLGFNSSLGGADEFGKQIFSEVSYVVPYRETMTEEKFLEIALALCKKYDQNSVMVSLPNLKGGTPFWLDKDANIQGTFGKDLHVRNGEQYYTKFKKR